MKRPQFGLRLMLLAVTLIAAILGLRSAILSAQLEEQARVMTVRLGALKLHLAELEKTLARVESEPESDDPAIQKHNAEFILRLKTKNIPELKDQIARFPK